MIGLYIPFVISHNKKKHISTLGKGSDKKITIKCPTCGKIHERYFKILAAKGEFECQACLLRRLHTIDRPDIGTKTNRWTLVSTDSTRVGYGVFMCSCGTTREVEYCSVARGSSKSCGCWNAEVRMATAMAAESAGTKRARNSKEYYKWRVGILERDLYTCQKCGISGVSLASHHLESFETEVDKRYDDDNGVTLCIACHNTFHKTYGYAGFSRTDTLEYINDGCLIDNNNKDK